MHIFVADMRDVMAACYANCVTLLLLRRMEVYAERGERTAHAIFKHVAISEKELEMLLY